VRDTFTFFIPECFDECEVVFLVTIRARVVRPVVPLLADLCLRNKLDDLDITRWWRLKFFEILFSENHVSSRLDLVTFLNLFGGHFVA
jgi:hypothetical protein